MRYGFEWDPNKARLNYRKHGVSFERAATIFQDPQQVSIPDLEHSQSEERWVTLGLDENDILLVVSHTFRSVDDFLCSIRLINARKATKAEEQNYEKGI